MTCVLYWVFSQKVHEQSLELNTPFEDRMFATGHRFAFTLGSRERRIRADGTLGSDNSISHPRSLSSQVVLLTVGEEEASGLIQI
jgi:hypothetical protein